MWKIEIPYIFVHMDTDQNNKLTDKLHRFLIKWGANKQKRRIVLCIFREAFSSRRAI